MCLLSFQRDFKLREEGAVGREETGEGGRKEGCRQGWGDEKRVKEEREEEETDREPSCLLTEVAP